MNRLVQMVAMCIALMIPAGCADKARQAQTEGVKIGELAPAGQNTRPQVLRATNLDVISFELPVDNFRSLEQIRQTLSPASIRYNDANTFAANGLYAGAGRGAAVSGIIKTLQTGRAKKLSTTSFLLPSGQTQVLEMARLTRRTTISYIRGPGSIGLAQAGPGILGLALTARQTTISGGLAVVQVVPVISPSTEGLAPELAARIKAEELRFPAAGFSLYIRPGEFVLFAPREYTIDENTVACQFFTRMTANPTIRVLLLLCKSVG